jgi:hypothetical protein
MPFEKPVYIPQAGSLLEQVLFDAVLVEEMQKGIAP